MALAAAAAVRARAAAPAARLMSSLAPQTERLPGYKPSVSLPAAPGDVQATTLDNGTLVVSQDDGGSISHVSVSVAAGSRNETHDTAGTVHFLRNLAFQSTANQTAVRITRESEIKGTVLTATSDREAVTYSGVGLRDSAGFIASTLAETIAVPNNEEWEIRAQRARVTADLQAIAADTNLLLLDDAHRAAFRGTGLGRPTLVSAARVGAISADDIAAYRDNFYTGDRTVVVGLGVDHNELCDSVQALNALGASSGASPAAKYYGGEVMTPADGSTTSVIYGFRGVPLQSNHSAAALVLRNLVGGDGSSLKWSSDATASAVGAAVGGVTSMFHLSGFSSAYADEGLFGLHLIVANADAGKATAAAVDAAKAVMSGDFTEEDLAAAKAKARFQLLSLDRSARSESLAAQLLPKGSSSADLPADAADKVAAVTKASVVELAKGMLASKPVVAARGNVDDIFA